MVDKIAIFDNMFKVYDSNIKIKYNEDDELRNIINKYFSNNQYRSINVFKTINKKSMKVFVCVSDSNGYDLDLFIDKTKVAIFKDEIINFGYEIKKPSDVKNKKLVLK